MKRIKKIVSVFLALAMVFGLAGIPAFAAAYGETLKLVAETVTVDGTTDKTVNVVFTSEEAINVMLVQGNFSTSESGTSYLKLSDIIVPFSVSATNGYTIEDGQVMYLDDSNFAGFDVSANGNIATAVYTVDKNTPAGEYTVSFTMVAIGDINNQIANKTYTAKVSVTNTAGSTTPSTPSTPTDTYGANIVANALNGNPVRVNDTLKVDIGSATDFAATEMTITYDNTKVSFDEASSTLGKAAVTDDGNGILKLADYGENKTADDKYVLAFKAKATGSAVFRIAEAGFGTGTTAANANLTPASVSADGVTIAIKAAQVTVSFDNTLFYAESNTVEVGSEFTFYPEQSTGAYYDYILTSVTMGGEDVTSSVTGNATSGWTIAAVTGDLAITGTRSPKNFGTVTYTGSGASDVTEKTEDAVYLSDISFSIPGDKAVDNEKGENGHEYTVTATIGSSSYSFGDPSVADDGTRTYTIPGANVKGAVTITVTKTELEANKVNVKLEGDAAGDGKLNNGEAGATIQVDKNGEATLKVDITTGLNKGYIYEVKRGEETVTLDANGEAKITGITENTTITINKTLNVTDVKNTVKVEENGEEKDKNYLTLNGKSMWLIQLPNHVQNTETAVYKYNGELMYWSADHENYVIAVISAEAPDISADMFTLEEITETPTVASNNWDVNKSKVLDANDAQLIWNMYSNVYQGFTDTVTVEKFLLADANHDGILDLEDAAVIIKEIFAPGSNNTEAAT